MLILIDLEAVVSVVDRLAEDLISHRAEVIRQSGNDFLVLEELQTSQISHINEHVIVQLYLEVTAFLDEERQVRLLFCEFVDKARTVPESLSDFHAYFSLRLLVGVKLSIVEDELLVLEEHRNLQESYRLCQVVQKFLDQGGLVHEIELL